MLREKYCVYNKTRESFLSLAWPQRIQPLTRLKGLIGKLALGLDEGLWMVPSRGIHTVGVLFPLDLVYLDDANRVLHVVESFLPFASRPSSPRQPAYWNCLPIRFTRRRLNLAINWSFALPMRWKTSSHEHL